MIILVLLKYSALDGCSSMLIAKEDGKTVWHLVAEKAPDELAYLNSDPNDLLDSSYGSTQSNPNVISMLYRADNDGNTPFAIEKGNFGFAESLINFITKVGSIDQCSILSIRNKKGVRISDIIEKVPHLARQVSLPFPIQRSSIHCFSIICSGFLVQL